MKGGKGGNEDNLTVGVDSVCARRREKEPLFFFLNFWVEHVSQQWITSGDISARLILCEALGKGGAYRGCQYPADIYSSVYTFKGPFTDFLSNVLHSWTTDV